MADFKEVPLVFSRRLPQPKSPPHVSVRTIDPHSVLPRRLIPRYRSEPHTRKVRSLRQRPKVNLDSTASPTSELVLLSISQVLSPRSNALAQSRLTPQRVVEAPVQGSTQPTVTALPESRAESQDSNECEIDLVNFIKGPHRRTVNVKEITIDDVFKRRTADRLSPLTSVAKAFQRPFSRSCAARSLLQTLRHAKPPGHCKAVKLYRFSTEVNPRCRSRWVQRNRIRLRKLEE